MITKELQDLAWSVLPKEFKEEVKRLYIETEIELSKKKGATDNLTQLLRGINRQLAYLFGHHNLTSDAEGEEMMTVEKSKAMQLYNHLLDLVENERLSKHYSGWCDFEREYVALFGEKAFAEYFGSKCLTDEVGSSNGTADNLEDKLRFEIGDIVVFHPFKTDSFYDAKLIEIKEGEDKPYLVQLGDKKEIWAYPIEVQSIAEIYPPKERICDNPLADKEGCRHRNNGRCLFDSACYFEPLNPQEPKPAEPKFPKGSMVHSTFFGYEGDYRVVGYNDSTPIYYDCINREGLHFCFPESYLEPYTELEDEHNSDNTVQKSADVNSKQNQDYFREAAKMKPIESKVGVYLATQEEDEDFRMLLHENGFTWNSGTSLKCCSFWENHTEEAKILHVYPDKTVTYWGNKTSDTLPFSEFKKQYFGENVNKSQNIKICDKYVVKILKDSFKNEHRCNIAVQIAAAVVSKDKSFEIYTEDDIARISVLIADKIISECENPC